MDVLFIFLLFFLHTLNCITGLLVFGTLS